MSIHVLLVGYTDTAVTPLCRAVLQANCEKRQLPVTVASCGFWAQDGLSAAAHTQTVAGELGLDLSSHRARYISEDALTRADWIIPQDDMIAKGLRVALGGNEEKLQKPMKLAMPASGEPADYRQMREQVLAYCERLLRRKLIPAARRQQP